VTLVVIFATIYVGRAAERAKKAEEQRGDLFSRSKDSAPREAERGFRLQVSP
jgi:hypothetical protein